jgi:hypothetical protein
MNMRVRTSGPKFDHRSLRDLRLHRVGVVCRVCRHVAYLVAYEIPQLLPHLLIAEPIDGGSDRVFRLVGTAIVSRGGHDTTGMRVRQVFAPDVADAYIADYQRGVASRAPWFARGYFAIPGKEHVRFESVGLPIFGRVGVTVWLLIGVFYLN